MKAREQEALRKRLAAHLGTTSKPGATDRRGRPTYFYDLVTKVPASEPARDPLRSLGEDAGADGVRPRASDPRPAPDKP